MDEDEPGGPIDDPIAERPLTVDWDATVVRISDGHGAMRFVRERAFIEQVERLAAAEAHIIAICRTLDDPRPAGWFQALVDAIADARAFLAAGGVSDA